MDESGTITHCPRCAYDISTTLADGIEVCPECGSGLTDPSRIKPRPAPGWARVLVFLFSISPCLWIAVGVMSLGGSFGLAGIVAVLVIWPLSSVPVYYANRALERWRHPIGASDRAFVRTMIALGLQLLIPMLLYLLMMLLVYCTIR